MLRSMCSDMSLLYVSSMSSNAVCLYSLQSNSFDRYTSLTSMIRTAASLQLSF